MKFCNHFWNVIFCYIFYNISTVPSVRKVWCRMFPNSRICDILFVGSVALLIRKNTSASFRVAAVGAADFFPFCIAFKISVSFIYTIIQKWLLLWAPFTAGAFGYSFGPIVRGRNAATRALCVLLAGFLSVLRPIEWLFVFISIILCIYVKTIVSLHSRRFLASKELKKVPYCSREECVRYSGFVSEAAIVPGPLWFFLPLSGKITS